MGSDILDNVAEIEELRGVPPADRNGEDIFLVTKQWLADTEIARVIYVMSASTAQQIRVGCSSPAGLAERRRISDGVRSNINRYATRSLNKGTLSKDSGQYLLKWVNGALPCFPKPESYPILSYRYIRELQAEARHPGTWMTPARRRNFDVTIGPADGNLTSDSDEDEVDLPLALRDL